MTLDEARDRIAELLGWTKVRETGDKLTPEEIEYCTKWQVPQRIGEEWHKPGHCKHVGSNPVEGITTLDGIAALMPKGWYHSIRFDPHFNTWDAAAWPTGTDATFSVTQATCPTEIEARTRLLLAVLEQEASK